MSSPIKGAAILDPDGKVITLPRPARHHDIIKHMADLGYNTPITGKQGFVCVDGKFVTRREAREIAEYYEQLKDCAINSIYLFSEDVW